MKPDAFSLTKEQRTALLNLWKRELDFLASMQLSNGALPMTVVRDGKGNMNPYFADFTALALLDAGTQYQETVRRYIDWHFAHLNEKEADCNGVDGTIYDYQITMKDGEILSEEIALDADGKKHYDSTDSYGATFLSVLWKYYTETGDEAALIHRFADIKRIYHAMLSTMQRNDLTFAKPDYQVEYLMDNCEVAVGAQDFAALCEMMFAAEPDAKALAEDARQTAGRIWAAIERDMWNEQGGFYETTLGGDGNPAWTFRWSEFYPSATAQLFPMIFGALDVESLRAKTLFEAFNRAFGNGEEKKSWQTLSTPSPFVWGDIVQAAVAVGDDPSAMTYFEAYEQKAKDHAFPIYNADAAKVCLALNRILADDQLFTLPNAE